MNSQTLLKGAGCGVLLTLWYTREILGPSHLPMYFHPLPLASVPLAVLADLVAISLLAAFLWVRIERLNSASWLWPVILAGLLLMETDRVVFLATRGWTDLSLRSWAAVGGAYLAAALTLQKRRPVWFRNATRAVGWSVVLWGFSTLVLVPQLVYSAARTSGHEALGFSHPSTGAGAASPRIRWILFDELSYNQVYEHRTGGLRLANFDRLRRQSVTFSNVKPAGAHTDIAIPSMFLGRPADGMRTSFDGQAFQIHATDSKRWERFDARNTVFADARRLGWSTGIVGWANPYCRMMAGWLDDCYWLPEDDPIISKTNMDANRGVFVNAASMPLQWLHTLIPTGASDGREYDKEWVRRRRGHYDLAMEHAREFIEDPSIRFEFIHLPLPHPPAIYDRKTGRFADHGSYLDNLALADLALGALLDELEKTPEWPETTLIVSGDHSWRPWIWQMLGLWTIEDQRASGGVYDPRPVLEIHLPSQQSESKVDREFSAVSIAALLRAMMRDQIHSPDDLTSDTTALASGRWSPSGPRP